MRAWISVFLVVVPGLQSLFQGPSGAEQYSQHSGELDTELCSTLSLTGSQFPSLSLDHSFSLFHWITVSHSFTGSQFPYLLLDHSSPLFYWITVSLSFTGSLFLFYWVTIFSLLLVTVSLPYSHCTVSHTESHTPCSEWLSV